MMLNLILNAVEALSEIREGSRDLLISSEDGGADRVRVAVQDFGPGTEPAECGPLVRGHLHH